MSGGQVVSETVLAVIITGVVTLLATTIGPLIGHRAARQLAREERRSKAAQELRPLVLNAIAATSDAVAATQAEHQKIEALWAARAPDIEAVDHSRELFDEADPTMLAARTAQNYARSALVEFQLSTEDLTASEAITQTLHLIALTRINTIQYRVDSTNPQQTMSSQDAWVALQELNDSITTLTYAAQPLTALSSPKNDRPSRRRRRRLLESRERVRRAEMGLTD